MFFRRSSRSRSSFSFRSAREEIPSNPIATWSSVVFVLIVGAIAGRSIDTDESVLANRSVSAMSAPRFALSRESASEVAIFSDPNFPREPESILYSKATRPEVPPECPQCTSMSLSRRVLQLPVRDSSLFNVEMPLGPSENSLDLMFADSRGGFWVVEVSPKFVTISYELSTGARTELSKVNRTSVMTSVQRSDSEIRVPSEPTVQALTSLLLNGKMVIRSSVQSSELCSFTSSGSGGGEASRVEIARGRCELASLESKTVGGQS